MGLKERLAGLQQTKVEITAEEREEIELREQIAKEEERVSKERRTKRKLDNERLRDEYQDEPGRDLHKGRPFELVDFDPEGARPQTTEYAGVMLGVCSRYIVQNPLKDHYNAWKHAAQAARGDVVKTRAANEAFVKQCLIFPAVATTEDTMCLSRSWELFGGDVDVLLEVALTLHGVRTKEERKSG